jgi:hypothetical protein
MESVRKNGVCLKGVIGVPEVYLDFYEMKGNNLFPKVHRKLWRDNYGETRY